MVSAGSVCIREGSSGSTHLLLRCDIAVVLRRRRCNCWYAAANFQRALRRLRRGRHHRGRWGRETNQARSRQLLSLQVGAGTRCADCIANAQCCGLVFAKACLFVKKVTSHVRASPGERKGRGPATLRTAGRLLRSNQAATQCVRAAAVRQLAADDAALALSYISATEVCPPSTRHRRCSHRQHSRWFMCTCAYRARPKHECAVEDDAGRPHSWVAQLRRLA